MFHHDAAPSRPRAVVLGGTGLIGRAVGARLLDGGWSVDLVGRDVRRFPPGLRARGARFVAADRADPAALGRALGTGADLVVDALAYTGRHARTLLPFLGDVAHTVMISAKAVYVDAAGNHLNSATPPRFDAPIREDQPTVAPGDMDHESREGYGPNKVAAERVFLDSGRPVTVLRPSKVHGVGSPNPREWVFVRRALDARPAVFLSGGGRGRDQGTAAANLAELVFAVASRPGARILNIADPDAPTALEISRIVATLTGHPRDEVLLDDTRVNGIRPDGQAEPTLGRHPWEAGHGILLDTAAARSFGYRPVGDYAATVAAPVAWLEGLARARGTTEGLFDGGYFTPYFDYAAEDAYLRRARGA
ncbi:NAD-dependent epimerase/dehydratase family protein [Arthrobacter halodurans]|uniref:NAD-dependent epimerase/dehydratase family protein n=1 Tax=Arthrobacter halodurans TaxID=516699 RepID=A0ABV4UM51_9MICC